MFGFRDLLKIIGIEINDIDVLDAISGRETKNVVPNRLGDSTGHKLGIRQGNLIPVAKN